MNIRTERELRGLLQETVAKAMGMSVPMYSEFERSFPTQQQACSFRMAMALYDCGNWPEVLRMNG